MERDRLVLALDRLLGTEEVEDCSLNGLQVEGPEEIDLIAFAVDASLATIEKATALGAGLLIVHHGLFWRSPQRVTGPLYKRLRTCIQGNLGLYASHLPLDLHPRLGHNATIARLLGLEGVKPFGFHEGIRIGFGGILPQALSLESLSRLWEGLTPEPWRILSVKDPVRRVAVVSGEGASFVEEAAREGYDLLLTGETSHTAFHSAREWGVSVLFAGHYATETFGLRSLQEYVEREFPLKTRFISLPTKM